ncbi:MAG: HAMP domain-containing histidine kinase, partial [Deltaproteobacteria bacterium]|nr:HAMP domain-containing histidine kinase [Deltaproteobacteria bacterium]MBW2046897.1 HAMP domain-containing histidine kinase [Deltaproteobacteria bacterium]
MTRLRGVAERALQAGPEAGAYEEALVTCIEESDQILRMLNTLMDISEAETGAMKLDRRELELGEVVQRVLELYRYLAEEKNIQISVRITRGLSLVADPSRIGQVLANLVDNAIKYTPENGRVDIEAYKSSEDIIISVKDTGSGISREDLPRIWDRLYRGDQSRSQRGLGLGLSLVKAIVAAHGGKVQVNSEPGRGSTFTITIPAGA